MTVIRYDMRATRSRILYPIAVKTTSGTKWGYINNSGAVAIRPQYEYANPFQFDAAVVQLNDKQGLIDRTGAYVAKPIYGYIGNFSEGRAPVITGSSYRLMNEDGDLVGRKGYSYMAEMHDGRAVISESKPEGESLYGYIDRQANEVIPPVYLDAGDFANKRAVVKVKVNEYALLQPDGKKLATYAYPYVGQPGDGYLAFRATDNGKTGYLNERGQVVIEPRFSSAMPFHGGRAIVNIAEDYTNQYGVIDQQGREVIKPGYNEIRDLGNERFAVGNAINEEEPFIGSVFAIFDSSGRKLTEFIYTDVGQFHHGLASATNGNETFFIDASGKAAQGFPRYDGSGTLTLMDDGIIQASIDQRTLYTLRNGRVVWQPSTIIPLRSPYRVKEQKYKPNPNYLVYYPVVEGMSDANAAAKVNQKLRELSLVKPIDPDADLNYSYNGDFDVAWFKKDLLVLELTGYNYPFGAAHGMPTQIYSHINVSDGSMYELKDLFKQDSDYVAILSEIVGNQIKNDPQYDYIFPDSYTGIKADQPFFVTEHALHLYFEPYEIAPYAAGFPTFVVPYAQIEAILDKKGAFWRSFNG
ncbi:WG repeat-containing protein [Paenibacillus sp. NEAU-GSW1]|uniref:WG repeat-containing protein n=1 Tax=Paenibacillus sp. NEAU-GSW1 TaxID=2682486 RepID=UPI00156499A9|nr:WG repeat-containing protein [Paenibacillus sp. NEAU-GSW1]